MCFQSFLLLYSFGISENMKCSYTIVDTNLNDVKIISFTAVC